MATNPAARVGVCDDGVTLDRQRNAGFKELDSQARHAADADQPVGRCARSCDRFRRALPRVEPFFAIKANAHPEIIKTMVAGRASFDVASVAEMNQVLAAGAKPDADHLRQHGQAGRVHRRTPRRRA